VAEAAAGLGKNLSRDQAGALADYLGLLVKWNRVMNLVGPSDWRRILEELVADSWHLADYLARTLQEPEPRSLDLGAGAGLPGIPLRLFWESGRYLLVEPRQKRAAFLGACLGNLGRVRGLGRTGVFRGRAQDLGLHAEPGASHLPCDLAVARAFLPWTGVLEVAGPLLAPGGRVVIPASRPEPGRRPPRGWRLLDVGEYPGARGRAYFWSFDAAGPAMASRTDPL
jgi:16S rRNA (guanine527-N7)-methyltransferase